MNFLNLDMQTILMILVLGHILTGILIVSYTFRHNKDRSVNMFLLSKLFQSIAWIILALKNIVSGIYLVCIGNSLLFIGAACELIALLILTNSYHKTIKKFYNILIIACIFIFNIIVICGYNESARIVAASFITAVLMAFPVYKLLINKKSSLLQKVISAFYVITIIFLLCRAYIAFTSAHDMTLWSTNIFNTWLFLLLYLVMLVGGTGFILLTKEKLDFELVKAATFDELTDIFNRRTFILRSKELISLAVRKEEQISYLLIDIDHFKKINDVYGHYMGDTVLKDFAVTIKEQLRDSDLFGRYGGEEFAVLLPGTDQKETMEIAQKLRKVIENSSIGDNLEIKYTISIGAATIMPDRETNVDMLYKLSDRALYTAKTEGKNRVVMCDDH